MNDQMKIQVETPAPDEAQPRTLLGGWARAATWLSLLAAIFILYTSGAGPLPNIRNRAIFLGLTGALGFLLYPAGKRSPKDRPSWLDLLLAGLTVVSTAYAFAQFDRLVQAASSAQTLDLAMAAALTLLMMELGRRTIGWPFVAVAMAALIYTYCGRYFPGMWAHRGAGLTSILEALYFGTNGIWGTVTGIVATVVAMFLVFGGVILNTGGGDTFVDISLWLAGRSTGGAGKVATVGSALFGMVSGSAAANAATTGNFTIPMMKRLGYSPSLAAAIEAVAATGGQIMPPIMGAGAFIMSELIGVPYLSIAAAAAIPAGLYYLGAAAAVHYEAKKLGLREVPREMIPALRRILPWRRSSPLLIPVVIVVGMVLYGYTPTTAAFWATLAGALLFILSSLDPGDVKRRFLLITKAMAGAGRAMIMLASLAAVAQVIIAMVGLSGLGIKLSQLLIAASGGHLLSALVLTGLICTVLGMGITTTADYVLAASVIGPALTGLGLSPLASHLFIFYWASSSALTPPVAAAVFVTSGIAGSNWWNTGWLAVRIGIAAFVAPFIFAYAPGLLLQGSWWDVLVPSLTALAGIILAAATFAGYWIKPLRWWERGALAVAAVALIWPSLLASAAGAVLAAGVWTAQRVSKVATLPSKTA